MESFQSSSVYIDYDGRLDPPHSVSAYNQGLSVAVTWETVPWAGAYVVYRSDDNGSTYHQIARVSPASTQFIDTPPASGDYLYKVSTETIDGIGGPLSAPAAVHYLDNLLPPFNVTAQNMGLSVRLTWQHVDNATAYTVYRAPEPSGDYVEIEDSTGNIDFSDTPPVAGPYYYRVEAFDNHGHRSPLSYYAYTYFTARPMTPYNLLLENLNYYIRLDWDYSGPIDSFLVFRATTFNGTFVPQFWSRQSYANDWPPSAGHYFYKIQAVYHGISSEQSEYGHVYLSGIFNSPSDLSGYDAGSNVRLDWSSVTGAASYDVYRGTNPDNMILNQTVYLPSASDTPPESGSYYYAVSAKTVGGLESPVCSPIMVQFTP